MESVRTSAVWTSVMIIVLKLKARLTAYYSLIKATQISFFMPVLDDGSGYLQMLLWANINAIEQEEYGCRIQFGISIDATFKTTFSGWVNILLTVIQGIH
jgi:hypothetical protein